MKLHYGVALLFVICSFVCAAQPRWSPRIRSEREMQWMKDSLHITKELEKKITPLSLGFQVNYDKAADLSNANRVKARQQLMRKKDADLKKLLSKTQYEKYYKRETRIRQIDNKTYPANRQPQ